LQSTAQEECVQLTGSVAAEWRHYDKAIIEFDNRRGLGNLKWFLLARNVKSAVRYPYLC
jgi:hypothetical protein